MQAHYVIDVRERPEPASLLRVKAALDKMSAGEILKVVVSAGAAADDVTRLLNLTGQTLEHVENLAGHSELYVKRVERKPRPATFSFRTEVQAKPAEPVFPAEPGLLDLPSKLEERFERILNELVRVWPYPGPCAEYINTLVFDNRGGRKGFPLDVLSDISALEYVSKSRTGEYDHSIEAKLLNNPEYGVD